METNITFFYSIWNRLERSCYDGRDFVGLARAVTFVTLANMKFKPFRLYVALLIYGAITASLLPAPVAGQGSPAPVRGRHGMVASAHALASQVGVDVMKRGGNAVDAAIAVGFALAVVYPIAGNIGGGGFMVIRKKDGTSSVIDYREMAPKAATRNIYLDQDGKLIVGEGSSIIGYRSAGVPGAVAGFDLALKKHGSGKLRWSQLIEPARVLARHGFEVDHSFVRGIEGAKDGLSQYPESTRIFLNGGKFFKEGDRLVQPDLADTLGRIQRFGPGEFYTGKTAELIAADMKANNGLMTLEDLKNYVAKERAPVVGSYRGHEIISMPPPSSGGAIMLETLNILEAYDLRGMGHNSAAKYHVMTEAMRRSFADRAEFMGDADFVDVPVKKLVDKEYAAGRRRSINVAKASTSAEIGHGEISARAEPDQTTHYTVVDAEGNVVATTTTINNSYGSMATVKGAGFLLNDEMDDFAAQPGKPNMFGLIQGERNAVHPGKRPLSAMTPTIVLRKDRTPWFALGAAGGPRIISAVLQSIINVIDHDMDIQRALDSPRIHHQWYPDELLTERYGMSPDTRKILEDLGHKFASPRSIATATGIMIDEKGVRLGAVDSRGSGQAVGY